MLDSSTTETFIYSSAKKGDLSIYSSTETWSNESRKVDNSHSWQWQGIRIISGALTRPA